mmetsp:Transcript_157933/g.506547  ORF Transcript_157933/g.506547 Transcript_157933/m.506547 type:complete len:335 (+) Transcript_157933:102-1106(+)
MDYRADLANTVALAKVSADEQQGHLPQSVLAALLQDPISVHFGQTETNEEVSVVWQKLGQISSCSAAGTAQHNVSQFFVRPLSFGRRRCFRLHRFILHGTAAEEMLASSNSLALGKAEASVSDHVGEDAPLQGSNIGGFQDIVSTDVPCMAALRDAIWTCVQAAAAADSAAVLAGGETTPPASPRGPADGFAAWMNVSGHGALNQLHNHGTSTFATVAYTSVPMDHQGHEDDGQGALLLRLSRGTGARFMEPDEDLHVPWMSLELEGGVQNTPLEGQEVPATAAVNIECVKGVVQYLMLPPVPGSILIFPGWLSHSVTPHFKGEMRVCFASNWS